MTKVWAIRVENLVCIGADRLSFLFSWLRFEMGYELGQLLLIFALPSVRPE